MKQNRQKWHRWISVLSKVQNTKEGNLAL